MILVILALRKFAFVYFASFGGQVSWNPSGASRQVTHKNVFVRVSAKEWSVIKVFLLTQAVLAHCVDGGNRHRKFISISSCSAITAAFLLQDSVTCRSTKLAPRTILIRSDARKFIIRLGIASE